MAYPTTLALIAALWSGPGRTRSIALWSALGGAIASLGPLVSGFLLERFEWGSVFLVTLPLAVVALVMAIRFVPAHVNETTEKVDNLGGILSAVLVGAAILGINFAPVPNEGRLALVLFAIAIVAGVAFVIRQRRVANPLYDLKIASRRVFWVAAMAGIIVFGSLMGAMFIGQQYLQNVLGYTTLAAGASILPAALFMVIVAPRSAKLVGARGAVHAAAGIRLRDARVPDDVPAVERREPVLAGRARLLVRRDRRRFRRDPRLAFADRVGAGHTGRDGVGDRGLQRDLGGAFMQSIFGALLTAGYAAAVATAIAGSPDADQITSSTQAELMKSFSSAEAVAAQYPQYATEITAGAKTSFLAGADEAYLAGIIAVLIGGAIIFLLFPKKADEERLLAEYHAEDARLEVAPG